MRKPTEEELSILAKYHLIKEKDYCTNCPGREICEFTFALNNPEVDFWEVDYTFEI